MAALFLIISQLVLLAAVNAGKYTVTDEVWFEVEVKDLDGPGQDYRGRFTVAVFGETAPMTTMNFVALARGYTSNSKTGVSTRLLKLFHNLIHVDLIVI